MSLKFPNKARFRFYEELNDFLPAHRRKRIFDYAFNGKPSVKDAIEGIGVPHTEVELILVNGESVDFSHPLSDGDFVSVYPVFESLDISPLIRLRREPLRKTAFILDVHLGKLARMLRLLGFDVLYRNDYDDPEIVEISVRKKRIILTRDQRLLCAKAVTHGYWVRSQQPEKQLDEVLRRFDLHGQVRPFTRCTACNDFIRPVAKEAVLEHLKPKTRRYYTEFFQCRSCGRVYWKGSHFSELQAIVKRSLGRKRE